MEFLGEILCIFFVPFLDKLGEKVGQKIPWIFLLILDK